MENFGLLIFRESCFLFKIGITSARTLYNCAIAITHEIVHQWAGDCISQNCGIQFGLMKDLHQWYHI